MLVKVVPAAGLRTLARIRSRDFESHSIRKSQRAEYEAEGWSVDREGEQTLRMRRAKRFDTLWEDRVWSLFYRMGFTFLSDRGGAELVLSPKEANSPRTQVDVVAVDHEVALAIECKASKTLGKRQTFQEELGKHGAIRELFARSVNQSFREQESEKLQTVLAMFLQNAQLSERDEERAKQANIVLFGEPELEYYERLTHHLGPAAKYQLLADMMPGKSVPGLKIRVPAVRVKMGGAHCYTFPISPEYLLKIAYVSHRSKGKASDVHTYQRMLQRNRLKKIREYIKADGVFPTNIVLNFEPGSLDFQRVRQEADKDDIERSGVMGWLDIRAAYKSAWIIDGQHRLLSYSGLSEAQSSTLSVLAFDALLPSRQAALFIDINSKQKSVKQSLLQELYAELHWDADEPQIRVRAILSKCVQVLNAEPDSPFYQRIQLADESKDERRCISLTSVFGALERTEMLIAKEKKGHVVEFGPLWAGPNDHTLRRCADILKWWFAAVKLAVPDWWEKGAGEGGGLSMNDGVTACINVLRSVLIHLSEAPKKKLIECSVDELKRLLEPFAVALGKYLSTLTEEERKSFRELRGIQGQNTRTRRCQRFIREQLADFNPEGLEEFVRAEKTQTNQKAREAIDRIELSLQKVILAELKQEFGESEQGWWIDGVPKSVRLAVSKRQEEDDNKRNGKEFYFGLIDYRDIVIDNWDLFEALLAFGKQGNKQKRTEWLVFINEKRNLVHHPSSAVTLAIQDLERIQDYDNWLQRQLAAESQDDDGEASEPAETAK